MLSRAYERACSEGISGSRSNKSPIESFSLGTPRVARHSAGLFRRFAIGWWLQARLEIENRSRVKTCFNPPTTREPSFTRPARLDREKRPRCRLCRAVTRRVSRSSAGLFPSSERSLVRTLKELRPLDHAVPAAMSSRGVLLLARERPYISPRTGWWWHIDLAHAAPVPQRLVRLREDFCRVCSLFLSAPGTVCPGLSLHIKLCARGNSL